MALNVAGHLLQLGPRDAGHLFDLARLFGEAFDAMDAYTAALPREAYLQELLGSQQFIALVALANDRVIGGITAYELKKFERECSEIYLYDLAVAKPWRRRGVATALIAELRAIAAVRSASVVYVQADADDDAAVALYTRLGKRHDVLHFDMDPAPARQDG